MLPDSQHHDTDLPQRRDRIAEMFGVPTGQRCASSDASPATPRPRGRLHAVLSWLWQVFLDGCEAYACGMYPCFPDPSDPSDFFGPRCCDAAEQAAVAPPEPSPWQFEALVRQHPTSTDNGGMQRLPYTVARRGSPYLVDDSRGDP